MTTPRVSGVSGAKPKREERRNQKGTSVQREILRPVLGEELLRAEHRCSRLASYLFAICGIAPCVGNDLPACDRTQLRPPVRAAAVPRISLCPDSNGSARRACVWDRQTGRHQLPPKPSMGELR